MNNVLSLQKLDTFLFSAEGDADSGKSICCKGSTESLERCCNNGTKEE